MTRSGGDEAGWPALRSHPCSVFSSEVVSEQLKRYASVTAPNSERISESPPPARAAGLGNRVLNAVGCRSMPNTEDRSTLSANDGVDGAPNGISVPRWSLSKPHLKGSRPWASLFRWPQFNNKFRTKQRFVAWPTVEACVRHSARRRPGGFPGRARQGQRRFDAPDDAP